MNPLAQAIIDITSVRSFTRQKTSAAEIVDVIVDHRPASYAAAEAQIKQIPDRRLRTFALFALCNVGRRSFAS